jgi:hypothetical protein
MLQVEGMVQFGAVFCLFVARLPTSEAVVWAVAVQPDNCRYLNSAISYISGTNASYEIHPAFFTILFSPFGFLPR